MKLRSLIKTLFKAETSAEIVAYQEAMHRIDRRKAALARAHYEGRSVRTLLNVGKN